MRSPEPRRRLAAMLTTAAIAVGTGAAIGPDVVACGTGRDVAFVDPNDQVASNCEVVRVTS